nr:hypothetical protein [Micromonospora sp. U56]
MLLAQVGDIRPAGLEDPQPEQAQQRDQGEVVRVARQPGGRDQRLELQVTQPEGRRLGRHRGPADVVGRRVFQDGVDDADPIEPDHQRQAPRDRRGLVPTHVVTADHGGKEPVEVCGGEREGGGAPSGAGEHAEAVAVAAERIEHLHHAGEGLDGGDGRLEVVVKRLEFAG